MQLHLVIARRFSPHCSFFIKETRHLSCSMRQFSALHEFSVLNHSFRHVIGGELNGFLTVLSYQYRLIKTETQRKKPRSPHQFL